MKFLIVAPCNCDTIYTLQSPQFCTSMKMNVILNHSIGLSSMSDMSFYKRNVSILLLLIEVFVGGYLKIV